MLLKTNGSFMQPSKKQTSQNVPNQYDDKFNKCALFFHLVCFDFHATSKYVHTYILFVFMWLSNQTHPHSHEHDSFICFTFFAAISFLLYFHLLFTSFNLLLLNIYNNNMQSLWTFNTLYFSKISNDLKNNIVCKTSLLFLHR